MIGRQGSALCRPWTGARIAGAAITERALSHKKITSHFRRAGETSQQLGGHPWIEAVQALRMCSARVSYWSGAPAGRVLPSAAQAGSRFRLAVVEDRRRHAE